LRSRALPKLYPKNKGHGSISRLSWPFACPEVPPEHDEGRLDGSTEPVLSVAEGLAELLDEV